jgi:aubergine
MLKNQSPPTDVLIIKNGTIKMDQAASIQAEVVETKEILKSVSKNHDPIRLTYIMLDKNSSQKFFLEKGDNILNPNSGTLINSEAVGKNFEFYLVAQQCNRGTVKPTYYKVAYSDSTLEEGVIE